MGTADAETAGLAAGKEIAVDSTYAASFGMQVRVVPPVSVAYALHRYLG